MSQHRFGRRQLIRAGMLAGGAAAFPAGVARAARRRPHTPLLSPEEMGAIDSAIGKKGSLVQDQAVYTVALPRADLKVTVQGDPVPTAFGFGGWVSFKRTVHGKSTVLMSDTVLLPEEVNGVISAAQANGLDVSAIHNHFFYEEPRIVYMHLHGVGETADLARRYAAAIRPTRLFPANQPPAGPAPARTGREIFDIPALDRITGQTGTVNGPTYKYTVGRADLTVMAMGAEITAAIGLNSWASFAGSMERAHIAGDIAMLEPEVNPVIAALRQHRLEVVAVHHHMIGEEPRIIFLHYFGTGPAAELAGGFRAALDALGKHGTRMQMRAMPPGHAGR
jgi:hypothetical protein